MATHTQPAGMDTRDRLLEAASREFAVRGYKGASLRQICASAGVTTGALYFFFKSKEDLFRTVVSPIVGPLGEMLAASVDHYLLDCRPASDHEVPAAAREFLELCAKQSDVVKIMTRDRDNPVMELLVGETALGVSKKIREVIDASGGEDGVFSDEFVADWLAGLAVRSIIQIIGAEGDIEDACRRMGIVFTFILAGLAELRQSVRP